ncbi:MAG: O-antigen ligase family protein [Planctomycetes bacterium]|nr:O-antigen ligase family protein [Planctomycetota bacterium]
MSLAPVGQRLVAALAALLLFADAVVRPPYEAGLSTFGQPPAGKVLLVLAGLLVAGLLGRAPDRESLARRLTLLLLAALPFGGRAVPASPGATLLLAGLTLLVARPFLRASPGARLTALVLLLCAPAVATTVYPQGSVAWLLQLLPHATLPLLLPSLFAGARARRPAALLAGVTALLCLESLLDYVSLADGLALPFQTVLATRLRPLGLHPNLAVPQIVVAFVLALALTWDGRRRQRALMGTCAVVLLVALGAVGSRTGSLTAAAGAAVLVLGRLPLRAARFVRPAAAIAVAAALLVPMTGLTDDTITTRSDSMVSKAVSFRSAMWELGRDAFAAAPWHGNGPGTLFMQGVVARTGRYDGLAKDDHPHNVALATGETLGLPGLLALAALAAFGLRRRTGGHLVVDGCTAALCAMWIANGIDMGGATGTILPALAFVLIGLSDAASSARADRTLRPAAGLVIGTLAGLLVPWGATQVVVDRALLEASSALDEGWTAVSEGSASAGPADEATAGVPDASLAGDALVTAARARSAALDALALAAPLAPLDPLVPRLRARAHALPPADQAAREADLAEALARHPFSAALQHDLAAVMLLRDPDDRSADAHLDEALRLDPFGPDAARVQTDRAVVLAHRGERDAAFEAFVSALVIDAGSVRRAAFDPVGETLTLGLGTPDGGRVTFPLAKVLADLRRRRDDLERLDAPSAVRLGMREVDVLQALGLWERADTIVAERFTDPRYLGKRLAESAERQGDPDEALRRMLEIGHQGNTWLMVDTLRLRAHASVLDEPAFDALSRQIDATLGDALFETRNLVETLAARKHFAERTLDAARAARLADALAYAAR